METDNLTLQGKSPHPRTLEYLASYQSPEELHHRVVHLFLPGGLADSMFRAGFYTKYDDGFGQDALLDCLRGLPANHEVVHEILKETNVILQRVPTMSALELQAVTHPPNTKPLETPLVNALNIADMFSPESIYGDVHGASYHILRQHLAHPHELPSEELVGSAIRGMASYLKPHHSDALEFARFLEEHKVGTGYMIRLYAQLGNERAIGAFVDAL